MNSYLTDDFLRHYRQLPMHVREQARKNYRLWTQDQTHPSLLFKRVHTTEPIYSVRVGRGLCVKSEEVEDGAFFLYKQG